MASGKLRGGLRGVMTDFKSRIIEVLYETRINSRHEWPYTCFNEHSTVICQSIEQFVSLPSAAFLQSFCAIFSFYA